jgi:hypothetical protein
MKLYAEQHGRYSLLELVEKLSSPRLHGGVSMDTVIFIFPTVEPEISLNVSSFPLHPPTFPNKPHQDSFTPVSKF